MSEDSVPSPFTPQQEKGMSLAFGRLMKFFETLDAEHKQYDKLLESQVALRGTILTYHLVTEQLISQELMGLGKHTMIQIRKMTYAGKLRVLPRRIAYTKIRKGLKELNGIRNRMAHDLDYEPTLSDIPVIVAYVQWIFEDLPKRKPHDFEGVLRQFVRFSIAIFASRSGAPRTQIDKLTRKFPRFKELFKRLID